MRPLDEYTPPPPPPPPPPPLVEKKPEPLTVKVLQQAPPEQAKTIVKQATPEQKTALKTEVGQLGPSQQQDLANDISEKFDGQTLGQLHDAFGTDGNNHNYLDNAVAKAGADKKSDYENTKAAADPAIKALSDKTGLTPAEIAGASKDIRAHLDAAVVAADKGDTAGVVKNLQQAVKTGDAVATKAYDHLIDGSNLPPTAKTILKDPKVVGELANAAPSAVDKIIAGDVTGAVTDLASNPALRGAVIDAAMSDPDSGFARAAAKLGLDATEIKNSSAALPALVHATELLAKNDVKGAALALAEASGFAPDLTKAAIGKLADQLPSPAREILKDDKVLSALAGASQETLTALIDGDPMKALAGLADNTALRDAVLDATIANDKDGQFADAMSRIGIDVKDADDLAKLKEGSAALPQLLQAAQQAATATKPGDWANVAKTLAAASDKAPQLVADGIKALAGKLPEPAKSILQDDNVTKALAGTSAKTLTSLIDGDAMGALEGLAGNPPLRDALIDSAIKHDDGGKFAAAMSRIGIDVHKSEDVAMLKQAGEAVPTLIKAAQQASTAQTAAEWKAVASTLAEAAGQAPQLVSHGLQTMAAKLPSPAKEFLQDKAVADALAGASTPTLKALIDGKPMDALKGLAADPALRDAVIDVAVKNDTDGSFAKAMERIGIDTAKPADVAKLKEAGAAIPDLIQAAEQAATANSPAEWKAVATTLADAAAKAPGVVGGLIAKVAGNLPDGLAKTILTDPQVADQLAHSGPAALKAALDGDAIGTLQAVGGDPALRNAVIDAAMKDEGFSAQMKKLGLTGADLKQAGDAAPHLVNAMTSAIAGDYGKALDEMKAAGDVAPELLQKMGGAIYDKLPDNMKQQLDKLGLPDREAVEESVAALPHLVAAAEALAKPDPSGADFKTAINEVLAAGEAAPKLATSLVQKLGARIPDEPKYALVKNLLADDTVAAGIASDPALHDAIGQLLDGDILGGASKLLHNDGIRDAVLDVVAKDPKVSEALARIGLDSPAKIHEAGAAIPHLLDAGIALGKAPPDWNAALASFKDAASASPTILQAVGEKLVDLMPQAMKEKLAKVGITAEDLKEAGAALPEFINAIELAADGKVVDALKALGEAVGDAPELSIKLITSLGAKLQAFTDNDSIMIALLTDKAFVRQLVTDATLHGALGQILDGQVVEGLKALGNDAAAMQVVANVLVKDKQLMAKLAPLGITTATQLAELGPSIADALTLGEAIAARDVVGAIKAFGALAQDLQDTGMLDSLLDKVIDKFDIKPEMKDLIKGCVEALSSPEVAQSLGEAFAAFKSGDPVAFIQAVAHVGDVVTQQAPGLAVSFLNALSHLPGSVGKFFSDPELNAAIVESGSLGHFFNAVEDIAAGKIGDAIGELGQAITSLMAIGDNIQLGPYKVGWGFVSHTFGPYELPISEQGLSIVGKLMSQFVEAMPPPVKSFLEEKAAKAVASTGLKSIPVVGPVIGIAEAGVDLVSDIKDGKDGITIALDVADLVVNGAGLIPGASAVTAPLRTLLGVAQAVNDTVNFVDGMGDFGEQFTGMAA